MKKFVGIKQDRMHNRRKRNVIVIVTIIMFCALWFCNFELMKTLNQEQVQEPTMESESSASINSVAELRQDRGVDKFEIRCSEFNGDKLCYRIYPHYFSPEAKWNEIEKRKAVQLIAQMNANRMERLKYLVLTEWEGSVSLAFYSKNIEEEVKALRQVFTPEVLQKRLYIHFVVPEQIGQDDPYPINLLRNVAFKYSTEDTLLLYDVDFQPMLSLHSKLLEQEEIWSGSNELQVFVVPAFEFDDLAISKKRCQEICDLPTIDCSYENTPYTQVPSTKADLQKFYNEFHINQAKPIEIRGFMRNEAIIPFHFKLQWGAQYGHEATNYGRWKRTSINYQVKYPHSIPNYEPYIVFRKSQVVSRTGPGYVWCDESFFNRGKNKIICVQFFEAYGYTFTVLHDSFIIHFFEERSEFEVSKKQVMPEVAHLFNQRSKQLFERAKLFKESM